MSLCLQFGSGGTDKCADGCFHAQDAAATSQWTERGERARVFVCVFGGWKRHINKHKLKNHLKLLHLHSTVAFKQPHQNLDCLSAFVPMDCFTKRNKRLSSDTRQSPGVGDFMKWWRHVILDNKLESYLTNSCIIICCAALLNKWWADFLFLLSNKWASTHFYLPFCRRIVVFLLWEQQHGILR